MNYKHFPMYARFPPGISIVFKDHRDGQIKTFEVCKIGISEQIPRTQGKKKLPTKDKLIPVYINTFSNFAGIYYVTEDQLITT